MVEENSKQDPPRPFDVRTVEYLLKLMSEHDLSEVDLREGDQRIRLRKGPLIASATTYAPPMLSPLLNTAVLSSVAAPAATEGRAASSPSPVSAAASPSAAPPSATAPATSRKIHEIRSPMVGTFYAKPKPDKPDYVTVGSRVTPTTVVCQIEAMKLFNEITADCTGTIVEVCAKNGDFVEYNQVLFRVELD
ncbi:MAG: acetyl-CoA carboxylase, biotin carboxyl carrier protein [Gemmataceae bacterium]|nr:acetyl-CoA carboxylase, biotin carboxyl carrier protein [Gemmataceae bacterium]MDW8243967.1 biotin/lipoyl-containing protein [Thermogemmata sp.]